MKKLLIAIFIIAVIVAAVIGWRQYTTQQEQAALLADLQTVAVEFGTLTATIGATGTVHSNQSAQLAWQTSGTVEQVLVKVGDMVSEQQILSTLTQTSLPQSVILAQADLVNAQRTLDNLFNSTLQQAQALQAVESAQQALDNLLNPELQQALALQAIADAEQLVEALERRLLNLQSTASQSSIDQAEAQVTLALDALNNAQEAYEPYADRPETDIIRASLLSQLSSVQQQYDFAVRNLNAMLGTASDTEIAVATTNLATAQARLTDAQNTYDEIKDGPSQASVALLEAQLSDAQREYERVKDGPDPDDIAVIEAQIAAAQATINQAEIEAPFAGMITAVNIKPGDQVNTGSIAFRVDDFSRLLVDLDVSEIDINQIAVGQDVLMSFDAILAQEYYGNVIEVALVGDSQQGVVSFKVTIELTDADDAIKPGMTSAVNIVINQLEDTLLIPNRAVRVVDGQRVVYTLSAGNQIEQVVVTLGASSDTYSQVLSGDLQPGDQVIINPPASLFQGGFGSMGHP